MSIKFINSKQQIHFKNSPLSTLSNFKSSIKDIYTPNHVPDLSKLLELENILFQGQHSDERAFLSTPKRKYQIIEMIKAQNLLEILDFLETVTYMNYIVNGRSALHKYLYSGFKLEDFIRNSINENVTPNKYIPADANLAFGTEILSFKGEYKQDSYPKTIRKYFEKYLNTRSSISQTPATEYNLFATLQREDSNSSNHKHQPRFYLPVDQLPEFLLSFAYNDGRDVSKLRENNDNKKRLPRSNTCKPKTETSFKFVLQQIYQKYQEPFKYISSNIVHLYRLDKIFFFNKLNTLSHYYKLYTSDEFLNQIIQHYSLSYREILTLEELITKHIFDDYDFISFGLQCQNLDFMLPFDIYFQFEIFSNSFKKAFGISDLIKTITDCKTNSKSILNLALHHTESASILHFTASDALDIATTKEIVLNQLKRNNFFKEYYPKRNIILSKYSASNSTLNVPLTYDIIKPLLPQ